MTRALHQRRARCFVTPRDVHSRLRLLLELAGRDLWFDRKVSLCIVASLIAVIAPLLLLFGLKHGVVSQLRNELLSDPRNLEIKMQGNGDYDKAWIERLAAETHVGFVMPLTRSLNTQADFVRDSQRFATDSEIIPSGPGDPLLLGSSTTAPIAPPQQLTDVVLSASAAKKLEVRVGDSIRMMVLRKLDGVDERGHLTVKVTGILPESRFTRSAGLVTLELLIAMENFRDGFKVPLFGFETGKETFAPRQRFAKARLYAKSLEAVAPLADWLLTKHVEVTTRAKEIESVQAIDRVLSLIFSVIAWTAVLGCVASLIGAFLANIDRKRKDLALLRLLGFQRQAVGAYIMVQATLLTGIAFVVGFLAYLVGSRVFNQALGANLTEGAFVCHLENSHIALAFASALFIASLVSGIGGFRAIHIQPAESLRDI